MHDSGEDTPGMGILGHEEKGRAVLLKSIVTL
jgi:hypothetical protein